MDWLSFLLPPAALGFAIGHLSVARLRRPLLALLLAAPVIIVGALLVFGLGVSSDLLVGISMVASAIAAWIVAAGVSYFAAKRFAA